MEKLNEAQFMQRQVMMNARGKLLAISHRTKVSLFLCKDIEISQSVRDFPHPTLSQRFLHNML